MHTIEHYATTNYLQFGISRPCLNDTFKDFITLPGVARTMIYASCDSNFALFNSDKADLYYTFKQNIIVLMFTRYHEKGVTEVKI